LFLKAYKQMKSQVVQAWLNESKINFRKVHRIGFVQQPFHRLSFRHDERLVVIASVFFFVRWFVGRFGCAVGQIHSLPSFGLCVGLCDLAMCVAVKRWH
jgi:hypothetical protein